MSSAVVENAPEVIVDAGPFGTWLEETRAALQGIGGATVPCGDCVGCCVSSYFVPVRPDDHSARAAIPVKWLVSAPSQSRGHEMMGYREDGTCPMLEANRCTIYSERPQTCRDYDCRIFAAAGIDAGDRARDVINRRVRAWRFSYESEGAEQAARAVRLAAAFISEKRASFPGGRAPTAPTGIAVLAVKTYAVFLQVQAVQSEQEIAAAVIAASREFDARADSKSQPVEKSFSTGC